jgi:transcriptional regulator with XRE-family HTH domain
MVLRNQGTEKIKMGIIVHFPRRHARTSAISRTGSRAARRVSKSAVTPAAPAFSVARTADHHSAGMLSRCHHFETADEAAPVSAANASREGQSSMTDRNDESSVMAQRLGQSVPKRKAIVSADCAQLSGHTVLMEDDDEKLAESQWREEFRQRLIAARGSRTQAVMAELLGIRTNTYGKYEGSRKSMMPIRLLPRFAKICGVTLEYLIEGDKAAPARQLPKAAPKPAKRKAG